MAAQIKHQNQNKASLPIPSSCPLYPPPDSINLLTDEIELLRDKLEDVNDPPDGSGQAGTEDAQQQDGDTQD